MKKSLFRPVIIFILIALTFFMVLTHTTVKGNSSAQGRVPADAGHENNQNNWGLFGIIGVIALAGLTKGNEVSKN
ncbi:MAG TPA: hypothetical protein VHT72_10260 [Puia sp.]|jgi:hypothetical protein|nr:hypothetical protein [Puia sp.]